MHKRPRAAWRMVVVRVGPVVVTTTPPIQLQETLHSPPSIGVVDIVYRERSLLVVGCLSDRVVNLEKKMR
jgi:hypothetical protein